MRSLLEAARAFAAGCEVVTEHTRKVEALRSLCETRETDDYATTTCVDRLTAYEEHGDYPGQLRDVVSVPWWQASEKQLEGVCDQCKARIQIWRARHEARKRIAGLKTAVIRAYRREVTPRAELTARPADATETGE